MLVGLAVVDGSQIEVGMLFEVVDAVYSVV